MPQEPGDRATRRADRRRRERLGRYAAVPDQVRRRLVVPALLVSLVLWSALLLGVHLTSYQTGLAPSTAVHRQGTVVVDQPCVRSSGLLAERGWQCPATVREWRPVPPADDQDLQLTDADQVVVLSRAPRSGTVEVVSRRAVFTAASYPYRVDGDREVIVPADQSVLPTGVRILVLGPLFVVPLLLFGLVLRLLLRIVLPRYERASTAR